MQDGVRDQAVTVRFRAHNDSLPEQLRWEGMTDFLAWTTTPWTLPANSGLALNADETYAVIEISPGERLIMARQLVDASLDGVVDTPTVVGMAQGSELVGVTYDGLYDPNRWGVPTYRFDGARLIECRDEDGPFPPRKVAAADFVEMESGTGIVHIAPAFGEDDYLLGREVGLLFRQPVDLSGRLVGDPDAPDAPAFVGKWVKDADPMIMNDLESRGLLLRKDIYEHTYPYCWRCDTPLLYYAKPSWYIATSQAKDSLTSSNAELIHWHPEHTGTGRYGDWLANNVDWAVSRERYWGTPLPFWRCTCCPEVDCVGSFDELRERARQHSGAAPDLSDPHRPYVDDIEIGCHECDAPMRRVPEVADAWFDSGAMPYAQWHYPFENQDRFDERFPADFICEAVDQTRGWFYSLHAEAAMLHRAEAVPEPVSFRNVISLGHILDEGGEKMSKSKGNVVDPWSVLGAHGADALRWYCYIASSAGSPRRFSEHLVGGAKSRFIGTLWNVYSFFVTYAEIDEWHPSSRQETPPERRLDRWILSEMQVLIQDVTKALDEYDPHNAANKLEEFVFKLSKWYVRPSRRLFWTDDRSGVTRSAREKEGAYQTLHTVLTTLARLLAPFIPYLSEEIWRRLTDGLNLAESVHLSEWPLYDRAAVSKDLNEEMDLVIQIVELGRSQRSADGIKLRQPLQKVTITLASPSRAVDHYRDLIKYVLNVKQVAVESGVVQNFTIKPNYRALGPRLGSQVKDLAVGMSELTPSAVREIVEAVRSEASVEIGGITLEPADIHIRTDAAENDPGAASAVARVVFDAEISQMLDWEGKAREVINRIQGLRRDSGLDPDDRISLQMASDDRELKSAVSEFESLIAAETLATTVSVNGADMQLAEHHTEAEIDGAAITLALERA